MTYPELFRDLTSLTTPIFRRMTNVAWGLQRMGVPPPDCFRRTEQGEGFTFYWNREPWIELSGTASGTLVLSYGSEVGEMSIQLPFDPPPQT